MMWGCCTSWGAGLTCSYDSVHEERHAPRRCQVDKTCYIRLLTQQIIEQLDVPR